MFFGAHMFQSQMLTVYCAHYRITQPQMSSITPALSIKLVKLYIPALYGVTRPNRQEDDTLDPKIFSTADLLAVPQHRHHGLGGL